MNTFSNLPADVSYMNFFIPTETTQLRTYHKLVKQHILKGENKDHVKEYLKYQRWMLGNDHGMNAQQGAQAVYNAFKAYQKAYLR
jgi:hypothetical protein